MHNHYPPRQTLLERDGGASNTLLADPSTNDLVLERLPNGEHAWLRLETPHTPRSECPQFVVRTETVYLVSNAPTAARVLQWFADKSDIDLDVETLDFGTVEVVGQVNGESELSTIVDAEEQPGDMRYILTDQGRRALAMALLFDRGPTIADLANRS